MEYWFDKKRPGIGPGWVEDRWLFANGEKGSQGVNTRGLSYTSSSTMANGACLVVIIVQFWEQLIWFPRESFFWFCFVLLLLLLYNNQELSLQEAKDAVFQTGDHDGIIAYQVVLQIASFYLNCCSWFTVLTSCTWNELLIQLV